MKDLSNKIVLITGAAMGMGRVHALNFVSEGSKVVITDINEDELAKTEAELKSKGAEVYAYKLDVSKRADCFALAEKVEKEVGTVDVLVNNAGIFKGDAVMDYSEEDLVRLVNVNQLGTVWMMQAFIPGMLRKKSGHVVNMCSVAGKVGVSYMGPYGGTKAAGIITTDSIRHELFGKGVNFTIVNPYFVKTGMFEGGRPPLFTKWLTPEQVSGAMIRGVKKNYAEVCVPSYLVRGMAMLRSMGFLRFVDIGMKILGEQRMMGYWREDKARAYHEK